VAHVFDAALKEVVLANPADFVPVFGLRSDVPPVALNVDLSTLTAATDVVLGFGDPLVEIADINFQSGPDPRLESRLHIYSAVLNHHHQVPVRTLLVLLRPAADHSRLTGEYGYACGGSRIEFRYEVVRLWQQSAEAFLHGGLGLLPLATLCELPPGVTAEEALSNWVDQIDRRLRAESPVDQAVRLMSAAYIFTSMRVDLAARSRVFSRSQVMHPMTAYDELLLESAKTSHRMLLRQGHRQFGEPDAATEAALREITDADRLDRLADAILTAKSWVELLATQ